MKVKIIIFFTLFSAAVNGQIRQPHSLYFMETIPQISQMNPAFQPRANGYVMLPNVNVSYLNDLAVKDIFQKKGNNWYMPFERQYDYNKLWKSIGKKATKLNVSADVDLIGFGFRTINGYFSFGISEHLSGNFALPSDLFKLADKGPSKETFDFSYLSTQGIAYMQVLIGYSTKVNDRLSIGMNIKPLFGQAALSTKIDKFELKTNEQQWVLDAKGSVNSSLPVDEVILDAEGKIKDINFRDFDDYESKDWMKKYGTALNNPGIALDLGAAYQINERLTASASLNNLGFISWNNDLNGITFNGKYRFNGIHYDTSKDDKIKDLFKSLGDSIADAMNYVVQHDKFKTMLSPILHAGATYSLSRAISVGFLSRSVFLQKGIYQSFNASFNLQPYNFLSFNAGTTWQVKGNAYLNSGLMLSLGPLQFYALLDYVPICYSNVWINGKKIFPAPERLKSVTGRVGLNFVFGKHGYVNKPMLDKGVSSWK